MEQNFRDLVRDLEKQKEEVRTALEQRERDAVDQVKVIVDALDERAKVLHEDKQTREQLHSISDSVLFLQVTSNSFTTQSLSLPIFSLFQTLVHYPFIHPSIHQSMYSSINLTTHSSVHLTTHSSTIHSLLTHSSSQAFVF